MTEKVVTRPIKVDLHIHSAASSHKDGSKVSAGTIDNIPVLVEKLEQFGLNAVSITDHDCFDYELYQALLGYAGVGGSLQKVFPGVEFSVEFQTADGAKQVHVITIFDDGNAESLKHMADVLKLKDGHPDYDCRNAFSEQKYWALIREIGLDIVTIAHQKNSPGSKRSRPNDANSVGDDLFNEFLFMEYFEVYEYKNRKNELFNKHFAQKLDDPSRLRFITGSDCHQWDSYPAITSGSEEDLPFTYLKCLPTFRGLAMAVTDVSRIKTVDSFFAPARAINNIELKVNGSNVTIPLSPGINAIIGDNSIGKSSIVNSLTGFCGVSKTVKNGQEKYLTKVGVEVKTRIPDEQICQVDGQESIRRQFEALGKGKAKELLANHFPDPVDASSYIAACDTQIDLLCSALKSSCDYQEALSGLTTYRIPEQEENMQMTCLSFNKNLKPAQTTNQQNLIEGIREIEEKIIAIPAVYAKVLNDDDSRNIAQALKSLKAIRLRHESALRKSSLERKVINAINSATIKVANDQKNEQTDAQKKASQELETKNRICEQISNLVRLEINRTDYDFNFETQAIIPHVNPVGDLVFVSKLGEESISSKFLRDIFDSLISVRKCVEVRSASSSSLIDAIKNYPDDEPPNHPVDLIKSRMHESVVKKLRNVNAINKAGSDVYEELSQGFNAQIYFSLLSDTSLGEGIYIVDQPEDQISQKAIRCAVLGEFRDLAASRQVLLITHNPQFVVNLDVDNVIFIKKTANGIAVQSGALEYESSDYKMLEVVADNIEGGLETIQRRMKRYEKAN